VALILSIASAIFAMGSLVVAFVQARVHARAIANEERDRHRQFELLQDQIEQERGARLAERQAILEVTLDDRLSGATVWDPSSHVAPTIHRYGFSVTNVGKAIAITVSIWLTGDEHGDQWESHVEERPTLMPGETWSVILGAYGPLRDRSTSDGGPTRLMLAWEDARGAHLEPADIPLGRAAT